MACHGLNINAVKREKEGRRNEENEELPLKKKKARRTNSQRSKRRGSDRAESRFVCGGSQSSGSSVSLEVAPQKGYLNFDP